MIGSFLSRIGCGIADRAEVGRLVGSSAGSGVDPIVLRLDAKAIPKVIIPVLGCQFGHDHRLEAV